MGSRYTNFGWLFSILLHAVVLIVWLDRSSAEPPAVPDAAEVAHAVILEPRTPQSTALSEPLHPEVPTGTSRDGAARLARKASPALIATPPPPVPPSEPEAIPMVPEPSPPPVAARPIPQEVGASLLADVDWVMLLDWFEDRWTAHLRRAGVETSLPMELVVILNGSGEVVAVASASAFQPEQMELERDFLENIRQVGHLPLRDGIYATDKDILWRFWLSGALP